MPTLTGRPATRFSALGRRRLLGAGLGLAIVKWIAEMHDGQVQVESTPGLGSRFSLFLPLDPQTNGAVPELQFLHGAVPHV